MLCVRYWNEILHGSAVILEKPLGHQEKSATVGGQCGQRLLQGVRGAA